MEFTEKMRVLRAVEREARARGWRGDLWAEDVPLVGTLGQQLAMADIALEAAGGRPTSQRNRALRMRLARAAVLCAPADGTAPPAQRTQPARRRAW